MFLEHARRPRQRVSDQDRLARPIDAIDGRVTGAQVLRDFAEHDLRSAAGIPQRRIACHPFVILRRTDTEELESGSRDNVAEHRRRDHGHAVTATPECSSEHDERVHIAGGADRRQYGVHVSIFFTEIFFQP